MKRTPQEALEPIARCCAQHAGTDELIDHLVDDFPALSAVEITAEVAAAQRATKMLALPVEDAMDVIEVIVRYRLSVTDGRISDSAHLDPQTHPRRGESDRPVGSAAAGSAFAMGDAD